MPRPGRLTLLLSWYLAAFALPMLSHGASAQRAIAPRGANETAVERLVARGQSALEAGQIGAARRSFARALRLQPGEETLRAYAQLLSHERAGAGDARTFLSAAADNERLGTERARAHLLLGEKDDALALLARYGKPQDAETLELLRRLAALYVDAGELERAERALSLGRRVMPQDVSLIRELSAVWIARGSPERAISLLQTRLQLQPDDETTRRQLACALHGAGRTDEAVAIFVELGHPSDLRDASRAALEFGDATRAVALAERAIGRGDEEAPARVVLGLALAAAGRRQEAGVALRRALALDPDSNEARSALSAIASETSTVSGT